MAKKDTQSNALNVSISTSLPGQLLGSQFVVSPFALPFRPAEHNVQPATSKTIQSAKKLTGTETVSKSNLKEKTENRKRKKTIAKEFARYFGEETKLENWQHLCRDVGIDDTLPSLSKCKLALSRVWINIYDLLDAVNTNNCPPRKFRNQAELKEYTIETDRIFPKKRAKEGGPVRTLLANIFH